MDHVKRPAAVRAGKFAFWICALAWLVAIGGAAWRAPLPFDAGYNLLPYKNWVETGRFEYRYGDRVEPFDPTVSTGPTVNAPIALSYLLARTPAAFFYGGAAVVVFYWALFVVTLFALHRSGRPLVMLVLTVALLAVGHAPLVNLTHLVPLGELPSAALVLAGLGLFIAPWPRSYVAASLLLGFAALTKTQVLVGLVVPAGFEVLRRSRRGAAPFRRRDLVAFGLLLLPLLTWKFVVPALTLGAGEYAHYLEQSKARAGFERMHALGALPDAWDWLGTGSADARAAVLANWTEKLSVVEAAKRGRFGALVFLVAGIAATAWLLASPLAEDRVVGRFGLFGLSILLWWLVASRLAWYRHLFVADFALCVAIAQAAATAQRRSVGSRPSVVLGWTAYAAALLASSTGLSALGRSLGDGGHHLRVGQKDMLDFAQRVGALDPSRSAVHALGWQQAPQIQLLSRNDFRDMFDREDVRASIAAGKTIFLVETPGMAVYQEDLDQLRPAIEEVLFDRGGYRLLWLDPDRVRRIIDDMPESRDGRWR